MKTLKILLVIIVASCLSVQSVQGRETVYVNSVSTDVVLKGEIDYHVRASIDAIGKKCKIDVCGDDAWLIFDNIKPNDVVANYSDLITISGKPAVFGENARVSLFGTGTVVMAHGSSYCPLTAYTDANFSGEHDNYTLSYYYTNCAPDSAPANKVKSLRLDNKLRSFKLKRGYMATLATNPDGMGYSRVYIADTADLVISHLPLELDRKVSYIRVFKWSYTTKKGWAGSKWDAMPEGLKYAPEQADFTNSTWYYNWGSHPTINPLNATKNYNQEYVPEKWGAGGLWNSLYTIDDACHLIGYNEPDHSEQSNVSVEKAIEEWPLLMQTGLRLGSPATTDFSWLYNFMSQCRKRNYRVDYVVIHAYWGGLSATEWYTKLKAVHDRTKRPLWIKEWNNGANWTKESWPSSQSEQYAKQLRDITAIVSMLDTCSFVERYSIYNWVEDKRMIIDKQGKLTPAGQFYADKESPYFFNRNKEIAMEWQISEAPVLSYDSISTDGKLSLSWTDVNGEQIASYQLRENDRVVSETPQHNLIIDPLPLSDTRYSIVSVPADATKKGMESNTFNVSVADNSTGDWLLSGQALLRNDWQPIVYRNSLSTSPLAFAGVATYRNKLPLTTRIRRISPFAVDLRLQTWNYQQAPSFYNPDTLSYMLMPEGTYTDGDMRLEAKRIEGIGETWQRVEFNAPFADIPIVVVSPQKSSSDTTFALCVRNVTRQGFEIRLRYEGNVHNGLYSESVAYMAATPGSGNFCGKRVVAGLTPDASVGSNLNDAYRVTIGDTFANLPLVFAQMQTENDTITSTLRLSERHADGFTIFKDREKSVAHEVVKPEQVGWIAIGNAATSHIYNNVVSAKPLSSYSLSGIPLRNIEGKKSLGRKKGYNSTEILLFNY